MKKFLVVFFILFITSYGFAASKDTLIIAYPVNAGPLNPHLYNPNQMYAQTMVYDSLIRYTPNGMEPALAESWQISKES